MSDNDALAFQLEICAPEDFEPFIVISSKQAPPRFCVGDILLPAMWGSWPNSRPVAPLRVTHVVHYVFSDEDRALFTTRLHAEFAAAADATLAHYMS